ncbi:hypothetical protein Tco_1516122 [Tanacetum coccineum]
MLAVQPSSVYKVGGLSTTAAEGPYFPLPTPRLPIPPSVIEDLSTRLVNLEYGHEQLVKKVIQVSDAEVAAGVSIGEIGPRVFAIEEHVQVMASQMVYAADRWEQVGAQVEQGLADGCAAERHTDLAAVDYSFRDGQPGDVTIRIFDQYAQFRRYTQFSGAIKFLESGEHTDAVYFRIGEVTCSIGEKTTRTSISSLF